MSTGWLEPTARDVGRRPRMRPPSRAATKLAAAIIAVAVGFLVGMQAGERGDPTARLAAESPQDLTRILADLNTEADELAREVSTLRVRLLRLRSSARGEQLAIRAARRALADVQVLSGVVPVQGPGLIIRVGDPQGSVSWSQLLDLVQEARDAGAEAVAVGEERVVASTWIGPVEDGSGIVVDGRTVRPPYLLTAIGSSADLEQALTIPGGPLTVISGLPGVRVSTTAEAAVEVPALQGRRAFEYARPTS